MDQVLDLYAQGGWLMPAITLIALALYTMLGWRSLEVQQASSGSMLLARAMIAVLPLLGLLGTVSGVSISMSEIARLGLSAQASSQGIGQALITTQYALLLALPAVLWERTLSRKVARRNAEVPA